MKPYFIVIPVDPNTDHAQYNTAAQAADVAKNICAKTNQSMRVVQVVAIATVPPPTVFWLDTELPTPHPN